MSYSQMQERENEQAKKQLGAAIAKARESKMTQRQLAAAIKLPPSNLKYIEDGVNC